MPDVAPVARAERRREQVAVIAGETGHLEAKDVAPVDMVALRRQGQERRSVGPAHGADDAGAAEIGGEVVARLIGLVARLAVGDVIATGTPGGVGMKRVPPVYMRDGDEIVVEIDGVGTLANQVTAG